MPLHSSAYRAPPRVAPGARLPLLRPRSADDRRRRVRSAVRYDILAIEGRTRPRTATEALQALQSWGLRTSTEQRIGHTVADILRYRGAIEARREKLGYIRGLGKETVDRLVSAGLVRSVADLFELREGTLRRLGRLGELSSRNLVSAIGRARQTDLFRFIYALGIPGIGIQSARDLAERFGRLDALMAANEAELRRVAGVGPSTARGIAQFFRRAENRRAIARCQTAGLQLRAPARAKSRPLAGRVVVLTGELDTLTRAEAEDFVRTSGGRPASSVIRHTDYLVAGKAPGAKYERARNLRVPILNEQQFLKLALAAS